MARIADTMVRMTTRRHRLYVAILAPTLFIATSGIVSTSPDADYALVCEKVSSDASRKTGVPLSVLSAISLAETGKLNNQVFSSWPWTVNMAGKGIWFQTETAARDYVEEKLQLGARNFDVGCFQLNYRWHGKGFASIEEMFDPNSNALYAANFLKELYIEKGNWVDAAGAYHSRTPKFANKYKTRFNRIHARYLGKNPPTSPPPQSEKNAFIDNGGAPITQNEVNRFPLLQANSSDKLSLGSLFPAGSGPESAPFWEYD